MDNTNKLLGGLQGISGMPQLPTLSMPSMGGTPPGPGAGGMSQFGNPVQDPKAFATNLLASLPNGGAAVQNNPIIQAMLAGTWQPGGAQATYQPQIRSGQVLDQFQQRFPNMPTLGMQRRPGSY
jgi:hypothetical protein